MHRICLAYRLLIRLGIIRRVVGQLRTHFLSLVVQCGVLFERVAGDSRHDHIVFMLASRLTSEWI